MKNILITIVLGALLLLLAGAATSPSNPKYQVVSGSRYPEIFMVDNSTGELVRYFFTESKDLGNPEKIVVESFGTPETPAYKLISTLKGREWTKPAESN